MAYATLKDVGSEFNGITFNENSTVNAEEVEKFIEQSDSLINTYLNQKYNVPVAIGTSPISFQLLKRICIALVAYRVNLIIKFKPEDVSNDDFTYNMGMLESIRDGDLTLTDAVLIDETQVIYSANVANDASSVFKMGTDQW